jgi:outer membrane protein TolC
VTKRQVRQATLSRELSVIDQRQTILDVATDIRDRYVQALRTQEQVDADTEYLQVIDGLLERAKVSQPSVVSFLETERQNALQSLESTKGSSDLAFSNLRQALRLENEQAVELTSELATPPPVPSLDKLLQIAFANRNDLKQTEIRLQQARIAKSPGRRLTQAVASCIRLCHPGIQRRLHHIGRQEPRSHPPGRCAGQFQRPAVPL